MYYCDKKSFVVMWDTSHLVNKQSCSISFQVYLMRTLAVTSRWGNYEEAGVKRNDCFPSPFRKEKQNNKDLSSLRINFESYALWQYCPWLPAVTCRATALPRGGEQGVGVGCRVQFSFFIPCQTPPQARGARWRRRWLISRPHLCLFALRGLCWIPICRRPPP